MTVLIVTVDDSKAQKKLRRAPMLMRDRLLKATDMLTMALQARVMAKKLSGQVLHVRTGTLRRSINRTPASESNGVISGQVGTNVEYAAAHEYGFQGAVTVKAHTRQIAQAWGRPISPRSILVGTFTKNVKMPERSFLRSALAEMQDKIKQTYEEAAKKGASEA